MNLTFDEDTHTYWLGKKRIPGVSEILQKVGLTKDWSSVDQFYAKRGKAVHLAIQYSLLNILDEKSLDPQIITYFEGFKKYRSEHPFNFEVTGIEFMGHVDGKFAGTIDLITDKEIIDWKCSKSHDRVAEIQGEAYKLIQAKGYQNKLLPFKVVQLPGDGSYEVFDYGKNADHWPSVMDLYRWKTKAIEKAVEG